MQEPFLKQVAQKVIADHAESLHDVQVVLPSERAAVFFKHYLSQVAGKTIWAPKVISINSFIEQHYPHIIIDALNLQFEFYEAYKQLEGDNAEPFERFMGWSATFLSDLNEIERYLVPGDKLFTDLRNIKDIEGWSLGEEELTEGQSNYNVFWQKLGKYRSALHKRLHENNKAYSGMAYRFAAENIDDLLLNTLDNTIYFAGFNALSSSEELIIKTLTTAGKAQVFWDADSFYLDDPDHEAGMFLRKYKESWCRNLQWTNSNLLENEKEITVIGTPQNVLQAKIAADLLDNIRPGTDKSCAVVLADETLLLPLLNSLPLNDTGYNVTMGYSLSNSPLHSLFHALLKLHKNLKQSTTGNYRIYHKDFMDVVFHPYFRQLTTKTQPEFIRQVNNLILKRNRIYLSRKDISGLVEDKTLNTTFFEPTGTAVDITARFRLITEILLQHFAANDQAKLELEYLFEYVKLLNRLNDLLNQYDHKLELKAFATIFNRLVRATTISFIGEPLQGAQIMGMLETRALDFENVILLSANEGILPRMKHENSYIPFDLKVAYKLPTHREKEAIFANHFYHLIQRASNVWITYNTEGDDFGGGERSRYLLQLEQELAKQNQCAKVGHQLLNLPINESHVSEFKLPNKTEVKKRIIEWMANGVSPSALNTYSVCSLDFYYKYIIGLRDQDEIEESVEAASLGTFIHNTLEKLYKPIIGKKLLRQDVEKMKVEAPTILKKEFNKTFSDEDLEKGKNLLGYKVSERFITRFLNMEIEQLKLGNSIEIVALEEALEHQSKTHGMNTPVVLTGKADRIDKYNGALRVIDYKTGKVESSEVSVSTIDEIGSNPKKGKALQVLLYALLYLRKYPETPHVQSGIVSFRSLSKGIMLAKINNEKNIDMALSHEIESRIVSLLEEIKNTDFFAHDVNAQYCNYC